MRIVTTCRKSKRFCSAEESTEDPISSDVYEQLRFDLCTECHKRFLKNPLAREFPKQFDFSKN